MKEIPISCNILERGETQVRGKLIKYYITSCSFIKKYKVKRKHEKKTYERSKKMECTEQHDVDHSLADLPLLPETKKASPSRIELLKVGFRAAQTLARQQARKPASPQPYQPPLVSPSPSLPLPLHPPPPALSPPFLKRLKSYEERGIFYTRVGTEAHREDGKEIKSARTTGQEGNRKGKRCCSGDR